MLRAAKLIKTGEVFELGAILSPDPEGSLHQRRPPVQHLHQAVAADSERAPDQEELVVTELGQIGTQIDAFAHQMWGDSFYNCFKFADIATRSGHKKLGVEHIGSLITRGVLIDVAGLKGVDLLPTSYNITPDDLQQALAQANQTLSPATRSSSAPAGRSSWARRTSAMARATPASASRPANGWSRRTR